MSFSRTITFLFFALAAVATASAGATSEQVLAEMNLARTQPAAYAEFLSAQCNPQKSEVQEALRFLRRTHPLPPLTPSMGLEQSSMLHVQQQGPAGGRGHGFGWNSPFSRMDKFGQWMGMAGENIYYGRQEARGIVCALIVDAGVRSRGHRKNIFSRSFGVAGVACGQHASYGAMCVIDFAGSYLERGGRVAKL